MPSTETISDEQDATDLWRPLMLVAAALLALRLAVLLSTGLSLHGDEAQYWTWAQEFAFGYYSKPPMIAWVIGTSTAMCGDVAWCVRLPAALLHTGTAFLLAGLARSLFDARIAYWTGVTWLTMPAVSLSSLIMSTDAVLLLFWTGALWAYHCVLTRPGIIPALALAMFFGLGLNAKYAMAYFLLCILMHIGLSRQTWNQARGAKGDLLAGLALGTAMILPNLLWNAANGWATVGHAADNAHWQGVVLHFDELADFVGAQFGVFGPILFAILLWSIPRSRTSAAALSETSRFLLAFSLPILTIVCFQALLSRANANWAATAYPAAAILAVAWLLAGPVRRHWLYGSIGLHLVAAATLYIGVLAPSSAVQLLGRDPFAGLSGWPDVAAKIEAAMQENAVDVLLLDDRLMTASLAYTLRDSQVIIRAWNHDAKIDHHYEMAWHYDPTRDGERVLLASPHGTQAIENRFAVSTPLPSIEKTDRADRTRVLELRLLEGPQ